jgi:hypothetical protein
MANRPATARSDRSACDPIRINSTARKEAITSRPLLLAAAIAA